MRRVLIVGGILGLGLCGIQGCSESTTVKEEKTISTPTGTTTSTSETEVKQTGSNPPPAP